MNNKFIKETKQHKTFFTFIFEKNNFIFHTIKYQHNIITNDIISNILISSYQRLINSTKYGIYLYYKHK
jgi:hypothetical protein